MISKGLSLPPGGPCVALELPLERRGSQDIAAMTAIRKRGDLSRLEHPP